MYLYIFYMFMYLSILYFYLFYFYEFFMSTASVLRIKVMFSLINLCCVLANEDRLAVFIKF